MMIAQETEVDALADWILRFDAVLDVEGVALIECEKHSIGCIGYGCRDIKSALERFAAEGVTLIASQIFPDECMETLSDAMFGFFAQRFFFVPPVHEAALPELPTVSQRTVDVLCIGGVCCVPKKVGDFFSSREETGSLIEGIADLDAVCVSLSSFCQVEQCSVSEALSERAVFDRARIIIFKTSNLQQEFEIRLNAAMSGCACITLQSKSLCASRLPYFGLTESIAIETKAELSLRLLTEHINGSQQERDRGKCFSGFIQRNTFLLKSVVKRFKQRLEQTQFPAVPTTSFDALEPFSIIGHVFSSTPQSELWYFGDTKQGWLNLLNLSETGRLQSIYHIMYYMNLFLLEVASEKAGIDVGVLNTTRYRVQRPMLWKFFAVNRIAGPYYIRCFRAYIRQFPWALETSQKSILKNREIQPNSKTGYTFISKPLLASSYWGETGLEAKELIALCDAYLEQDIEAGIIGEKQALDELLLSYRKYGFSDEFDLTFASLTKKFASLENLMIRIGNLLRLPEDLDEVIQCYQYDYERNMMSSKWLASYVDLLIQGGHFSQAKQVCIEYSDEDLEQKEKMCIQFGMSAVEAIGCDYLFDAKKKDTVQTIQTAREFFDSIKLFDEKHKDLLLINAYFDLFEGNVDPALSRAHVYHSMQGMLPGNLLFYMWLASEDKLFVPMLEMRDGSAEYSDLDFLYRAVVATCIGQEALALKYYDRIYSENRYLFSSVSTIVPIWEQQALALKVLGLESASASFLDVGESKDERAVERFELFKQGIRPYSSASLTQSIQRFQIYF